MQSMRYLHLPRILALTAIFALSFGIGLLFVDQIKLPFSNPWNIKGPLAAKAYNPNNDVVRFLFLVFLPSICLTLCSMNKKQRTFLARKFEPPPSFNLKEKKSTPFNLLLILLLLVALFFSTGNTYRDFPLDTFHEGETLGPAIDYVHGKIPYKETVFIHGPFSDPLRAVLAFKLFGQSIGALRTLDAVLGIIMPFTFLIMLFFLFARNIPYTALAFSLFLLINHFRPLGILLTIGPCNIPLLLFIMIAAMMRDKISFHGHLKHPPHGLLFFFTFFPTLAFSCSIDRGLFLVTAATLSLCGIYFLLMRGCRSIKGIMSILGGYTAGVVVFGFAIKGAYASSVSYISTLLQYEGLFNGFIYPYRDIRFLVPVIVVAGFLFWLMARLISDWATNWVTKGVGFKETVRHFFASHFMEIVLLLLVGCYYRRALGRSDLAHLSGVLTPMFILGVLIASRHYLLPYLQHNGLHRKLLPPLSVLLIGGYLVFALPGTNWARFYRFPLDLPDAAFIPQSYVETAEYLKERLKAEDRFLTLTSEAGWYYFLDTPCPSRFNVIYQAMPPFYQDEIISDLKKNVKYVLYKNDHWANAPEGYGVQDRISRVTNYIEEHFTFHKKIGSNELWIRKTSGVT